ncbi:MAG: hypothetical protein ISQ46_05630 [Methylophilaceae bacterium]|nr:hypothetical protein [Methylophilaceae bacterium]
MRYFIFIVCFISIGFANTANALRAISPGFQTGNDYLEKSNSERSNYIMGITDGVLSSLLYLNKEIPSEALDDVESLKTCLTSRVENLKQLTAIVDKYLQNNPERWAEPMSLLYYNSVKGICSFK